MTIRSSAGRVSDVSAQQAYAMLERDKSAVLVDVRTKAEWSYVGVPDISGLGKQVILLEWQQFPEMTINADFTASLEKTLLDKGAAADAPVLFLCRSGVRSRAAAIAMSEAGWSQCFNIANGFEGPLDDKRRRGALEGWKAQGLPWMQS